MKINQAVSKSYVDVVNTFYSIMTVPNEYMKAIAIFRSNN
jgi:hypothetical protein